MASRFFLHINPIEAMDTELLPYGESYLPSCFIIALLYDKPPLNKLRNHHEP